MTDNNLTPDVHHYDAAYGHFSDDVYTAIRAQTYDKDIGQSGWLTAAEQDNFIAQLALTADTQLLDVGCGSGGPTLRIAEVSGCIAQGVDIHAQGITNANLLATERGLSDRVQFQVVDAGLCLPFDESTFDAVMCIDSIDNLPDRAAIMRDWFRVLKPGGRLLFTDSIVVTGELTDNERKIRSSIGYMHFSQPDENDSLLEETGFQVAQKEDHTHIVAKMAERWGKARVANSKKLIEIEGNDTFTGNQKFYAIASKTAAEKRLSRFIYVALKP